MNAMLERGSEALVIFASPAPISHGLVKCISLLITNPDLCEQGHGTKCQRLGMKRSMILVKYLLGHGDIPDIACSIGLGTERMAKST
jgi:hypothetical protein